MGTRGPLPVPAHQLRGKRAQQDREATITRIAAPAPGTPRPANSKWKASVKQLWDSLGNSQMSAAYQESDWAVAWILCEVLNESLTSRRANGMLNVSLITSTMTALSRLGATVADRRRLGITLENQQPDDSQKVAISKGSGIPVPPHSE